MGGRGGGHQVTRWNRAGAAQTRQPCQNFGFFSEVDVPLWTPGERGGLTSVARPGKYQAFLAKRQVALA